MRRCSSRCSWGPLAMVLPALLAAACGIVSGLDEYRLVVYEPAPTTTTTGAGGAGGTASTMTSAGGIGGAGGTGGLGGDGSGGGAPPVLDDTGLIARYYIDEAGADTLPNPAELVDAAPTSMNLAIDPAGVQLTDFSFVQEQTGRGLRWGTSGSDAKAWADIAGGSNKVNAGLNGKMTATLEVVARIESTSNSGAPILGMSRIDSMMNNNEHFSLYARRDATLQGLELKWDGSATASASTVAGAWDATLATRAVIHLVLDTAEALPVDRVRLYLDGAPLMDRAQSITGASTTAVVDPQSNETIALATTPGLELVLGNRAAGSRSPAGVIFYAAIYSEAFTPGRVMTHAQALGAADDTPLN